MNILSVDVGTTSMRGILYDRSGAVLNTYSLSTPLVFSQNFIEQTPEAYRHGLVQICRSIAATHTVDAISLTAFRSAPTLADADGNALCNFIMWQDTRNHEICRRLSSNNQRVYEHTGASINAVFTATKITWFRENMPDVYRKAYKAMIVPDFLIQFMTGEFVTDKTYGSRTSLMNIRTLAWDKEMCELFHIDEDKLCRLTDQGTIAGYTTCAFHKLTGIAEGIPVISAGGDQQCSALGLGELDDSSLVINSGTGSFVLSLLDEPYLENHNMICNVSAIPGKYIVESNILASAAAVNWTIRELFPEYWNDGEPDFGRINSLAEDTAPLAGGLSCIPHFQGCGTRDWNPSSRAVFCGLSLQSRRSDFIRALYEGIAAEIAKSVAALPASCQNVREIYVGGGLTKSNIYNQILSDMLGRQLIRYSDSQATAIGAFVSAAVCLGLYDRYQDALASVRKNSDITKFVPNTDNHGLYQSYIEDSEKIYRSIYS